jgi:hypothetical protein
MATPIARNCIPCPQCKIKTLQKLNFAGFFVSCKVFFDFVGMFDKILQGFGNLAGLNIKNQI